MRSALFLSVLLAAAPAAAEDMSAVQSRNAQLQKKAAEDLQKHLGERPRRDAVHEVNQEYDMKRSQELQRRQFETGKTLPAEQRSRMQKAEFDRFEAKVQREDRERKLKAEALKQEKERDMLDARRQQRERMEQAKSAQARSKADAKKMQDLSTRMRAAQEESSKPGPDGERAKQRYEQLLKEYNKNMEEWKAQHKATMDIINSARPSNPPDVGPGPDGAGEADSGFDR